MSGDPFVYLDHNATTPVHPEVVEAMLPFLTTHWGNPSSSHAPGRAARRGVERAREQVAALLGARPESIVFTSGGTESDNLAIHGALRDARPILTSPFEHPAVEAPLAATGLPVLRLDAGPDGQVTIPDALPSHQLLTLILAQNETGVLQPVEALARASHAQGAMVHTDAAQAVGKVPVDVVALDVDLLTVAGHKLGAPKGVGALYVRPGTPLRPFLRGADQEAGRRPGTENVAGIVALGAACTLAARDLGGQGARLAALRDRLHQGLAARVPGLVATGSASPRLPNTLHLRFPRVSGAALLGRCPQLAASTGSACHEGIERPSSALLALGLTADQTRGALRLSLGRSTTAADVDAAITWLASAWEGEVAA